MFVCVCVRERERDRQTDRQADRQTVDYNLFRVHIQYTPYTVHTEGYKVDATPVGTADLQACVSIMATDGADVGC